MGMKGVWVLTVVLAFVVGSLVTGAAVFADDDDDDGNNAIVAALNDIRDAILGINPTQTVTVESATPDITVESATPDITLQSIVGPQGPEGDTGPIGPQGPVGPAIGIQSFHLTATGDVQSPTSATLIPGLTQSFSVSSSATVYVISNINFATLDSTNDEAGITLRVDGSFVQLSPLSNSDTPAQEVLATVSWTGTVGAGDHTVEIFTQGVSDRFCPSTSRCILDILVFE